VVAAGVRKDEIDILYAASNKLTQASTPQEQLAAISDYARENGAESGTMFYIDNDLNGKPEWAEIVADWALVDGHRQPELSAIGARYYLPDLTISKLLKNFPDIPYLVEDVTQEKQLDRTTRDTFQRYNARAAAILPLNSKGRWVGLLMFNWRGPRRFSESDQRIYTALMQQAAPVVDSVRLFEQTQKRASELENAKDEIEILYTASNKLAHSTTPEDLLEAVSAHAREMGASTGELLYFSGHVTTLICEIVAEWKCEGGITQGIGQRFGGFGSDEASSGWMAQPDQPLLVTHAPDDTRFLPGVRYQWVERNISSFAILPLNNRGRWVGLITFGWHQSYQFTERDKRIYTALIQQAAPVIDSIRLLEQNRQRALRAEHLLQVNTALSRATNEFEILSAVAQCAVPQGAQRLFLDYADIDEHGKTVDSQLVAMWENGTVGQYDPAVHEVHRLDEYDFPAIWENEPGEVIFIEDFSTSEYFSEAVKADLLPRIKGRAVAIMPLYSGRAQQGIISIVWYEPHLFTSDEKDAFQGLLPTVASIVATRRAYLAEQERARELETVAKVSAAAARILDVNVLLKTAVELTQLDFAGYHLAVYLLDPGGQHLEKTASAIKDHFIPPGFTISLSDSQSVIALAGAERRSIIVNDIGAAATYRFEATNRDSCSEMTIPMVVADKLIGVLDVQSPDKNRFSEANARVMSMLADLIAVAVQNARLYEQAQELAALEERNRLARELHDSVSQALYGIALGARTARTLLENDPTRLGEPLDYVLTLAEAGLTEMRALIFDLRPESLENEGLITALGKQVAVLQGRHGIHVLTEFCEEPVLLLEVKEMLYRIAREALHNTVKHAQASQVSIHLKYDSSGLKLEIADNGLGFDRDGSFPGHLGLHSMRERAARLNAIITIDSAPGMGTRIVVRIPLSSGETYTPTRRTL
jgi:signal transduction histidine kinase